MKADGWLGKTDKIRYNPKTDYWCYRRRRLGLNTGGNSGGEIYMYDFVINVPISSGPVLPIWLPVVGGLPINSPLVGSFLGVFLGFLVNYIYQYIKNFKDKIYYRNNIKSELELCIERLEKTGNLLPVDRWISTLNSGALRFFNSVEVENLSRAYEAIQNNNYEAKRVRDLGEDYRRYLALFGRPDKFEVIELGRRWEAGSANLESKRIKLQKCLQEVKNSLQEKGLELYLGRLKKLAHLKHKPAIPTYKPGNGHG